MYFPPVRIELGLTRQFAKALGKKGSYFAYLCQTFPRLIIEKLKAEIFDDPQIRHLIKEHKFYNSMNKAEIEAWNDFVLLVKNFPGNN